MQKDPEAKRRYMVECCVPGKSDLFKREFRLKWCQMKLQDVMVQKHKLEEYQIIDRGEGTFETFENIVMAEGGKDSPAGWQVAINYVTAASKMGGGCG